jgi:hypothetical protein
VEGKGKKKERKFLGWFHEQFYGEKYTDLYIYRFVFFRRGQEGGVSYREVGCE